MKLRNLFTTKGRERREIERALKLIAKYADGDYLIDFRNGIALYDGAKPIALCNLLAGGWDRVALYLTGQIKEAK